MSIIFRYTKKMQKLQLLWDGWNIWKFLFSNIYSTHYFIIWEMLTSIPETLVNESNIVVFFHW